MKKGFIVVFAFVLLTISPMAANAKSLDASPAPTDSTPVAQSGTSLSIDDANIYSGMDKAYQNGYVPQVKDGYATVILPLIADGPVKGNAIIVTPGLGDTASSPFVFMNYQKTIALAQNSVNGGGTVASYLVRFDLLLKDDRINGTYPVTVNIQAQGPDGSGIQQAFTAYVTIADGGGINDSQPKVIVSDSSVSPSAVTAGDAFTVRVTLKNIGTKSVKNLLVTASCDSQNITLKNDSDTLVVGSLGAGKTTTVNLSYQSDLETPEQQYKINLAISYENSESAPLSSTGTVTFTVGQPLRVEMEQPQIAQQVNAGDTLPVSFQVMNMGRSKVYNVRMELSALGLFPTSVAFIGTMDAGTAANSEMDVFIGTRDMSEGHTGEEKYGLTNGVITLLYEDAKGQEYTKTLNFTTTINKPVIAQVAGTTTEAPKAGQWWISVVVGCVVVAGLAALLIMRKKHRVSGR